MTNAQKVAPDIVTLLAHTWAAQGTGAIDADAIPRIWAYDMGWFDIETARLVRDSLLQTDWLVASDGGLLPAINIDDAEHTFGWMPLMRTLRDPPQCPRESTTAEPNLPEIQQTPPATPEAASVQPETIVQAPIDPAAAGIESLLSQVTSSSGLAKKEVLRRAQRKRRALGPITLWMCILLVAREQDLQVGSLLQSLGE